MPRRAERAARRRRHQELEDDLRHSLAAALQDQHDQEQLQAEMNQDNNNTAPPGLPPPGNVPPPPPNVQLPPPNNQAPPPPFQAPAGPQGQVPFHQLHYHGLPQKPPNLKVTSESCNVKVWHAAIIKYARVRGCLPAIDGDPAAPQAMEDEISMVVLNSIPDSALDAGLPPDIMSMSTYEIIKTVLAFCDRAFTPQDHYQLANEANNLTLDKGETTDEFVARHLKLRRRMLEMNVPGITDERMTNNYIIYGLRTRGSLKQHMSVFIGQDLATVEDLKKALRRVSQNEDRLYQERTKNNRGRGRGGSSSYKMSDAGSSITPSDKGSTSKSAKSSGRGARGGRGRGRGGRHANAVMHSDSGKPSEKNTEEDDDEDISEPDTVNAGFTSYTLDSAAYPTYLAAKCVRFRTSSSSTVLPDGSHRPILRLPPLLFEAESGHRFSIKNACAANFNQNLLSIPQITDQNGCTVTFRRKDAIFKDNSTGEIIARAPRIGTKFVIRLKNIQQPDNSACAITPHRVFAQQPDDQISPPPKSAAVYTYPSSYTSSSSPQKPVTVKPYLPKPRSQLKTNAIPYPAHMPDVSRRERTTIDAYYDWHIRLNHTPLAVLHKMALDGHSGLPDELRRAPPPMTCAGCNIGHQYRSSHKSTSPRPTIGHTIATDLAGPLPKTKEGHQYILTVTELHSRMRFISLLRTRQETPSALLAMIAQIERHTGTPIARVRSDNANEYLTKKILDDTRARGTAIDPTVPHTPQQNSIAERLNRTLLERVRATLGSMQLPFEKYWALCALNTIEKLNLTHQTTIDDIPRRLWEKARADRSPFYPRSLDLKQFRAFGEYGHVPRLQDIKSKGDPRSVLVRYLSTPRTGIFQVLDPSSGQLFLCRAVDYRPYNAAFDPQRFIAHALPLREAHRPRVNAHHAIPNHASSTEIFLPAEHVRNPEPIMPDVMVENYIRPNFVRRNLPTLPVALPADPVSIVPASEYVPLQYRPLSIFPTVEATQPPEPFANAAQTPQPLPMASAMPPPPESLHHGCMMQPDVTSMPDSSAKRMRKRWRNYSPSTRSAMYRKLHYRVTP